MKSILFSLLFLFIPKLCISQVSPNDLLIYLDSIGNNAPLTNHHYFRIIKDYKLNKESYIVNDYYKSGVLMMRSTSNNKDFIVKEGQTIFYYENKNKKSICNYTKNHPNGKEIKWYENGNKKEDGEYILLDEKKKQSEYKVNQFWDINGVQKVADGNGDYEENDKNFFGSGKVKDGLKDGVWLGWVKNPKNKYTETYKNGKLTSGTIVDENNIESTYTVLEKKPEPKNGMSNFYNYVAKNFNMSNLPSGIKGKIYIAFVVDKDGKIIEPKILRDLGYGTGAEAIRILTEYKDFMPGEQRGKKIKCKFTLPITIEKGR
ncbi:MAG TPA: energy transducer TonB [Flavobacterium sp.]